MYEPHVAHVEGVLQILKVIAFPHIRVDLDEAIEMLELGVQREFRRRSLAEISKNQSEIFPKRVASYCVLTAGLGVICGALQAAAIL
jgi:hypothetical protein